MFKDDYIVRVIAQATAALATVIGLRKAGRQGEALNLVDQTLQQFWGLNLGMAGQLPVENLLALAQWQETLDLGKLVILADVFQAEADIYADQGRGAESEDRRLKALAILLELARTSGAGNRAALGPRIEAALAPMADTVFPAELNDRLAEYYDTLTPTAGTA